MASLVASVCPRTGSWSTLFALRTDCWRSTGTSLRTRSRGKSQPAAFQCSARRFPPDGLEDDSEAVRTKGLVGRRTKGRQEGTNMKLQGNVLKRNSMRFAAALLAALASFVTAPNSALAAAPQHHDQAPGFYRLKVGDLEVTALYDGTGVFDPHWLNGTKAAMDGVAQALHEDPHMLNVIDTGFLVNTGKQLILVDAGAGIWWGGGALGRLAGSLRSAGYSPEEVDLVLVTHLHSDHVGGLTTQDGKRVFSNADVYVAKAR